MEFRLWRTTRYFSISFVAELQNTDSFIGFYCDFIGLRYIRRTAVRIKFTLNWKFAKNPDELTFHRVATYERFICPMHQLMEISVGQTSDNCVVGNGHLCYHGLVHYDERLQIPIDENAAASHFNAWCWQCFTKIKHLNRQIKEF